MSDAEYIAPIDRLRAAASAYYEVKTPLHTDKEHRFAIFYGGVIYTSGYKTEEEAWESAIRFYLLLCGVVLAEPQREITEREEVDEQ